MSLRHAAPSPLQLPNKGQRLVKEQSRRPLGFLSGHAYQDGKGEHRGYLTQEADLRGVYDAHGGYEIVEVCVVRRIGIGRRLHEGPGKRVDGVSPVLSGL